MQDKLIDKRDYDKTLQMFKIPTQEPNLNRLRYLRYLAEQGQLEHVPVGPSCGEYAPKEETDVLDSGD